MRSYPGRGVHCPRVIERRLGSEFLEGLRSRLHAVELDVEQLAAGLGEPQLAWVPAAGRWSIAQCLEHVAAVSAAYGPPLASAAGLARRGTACIGRPRHRPGWLATQIAPLCGSPRRRGGPADGQASAGPASGSLGRFLAEHRRLIAVVESLDGYDVALRLRAPTVPLLRLRLGDVLALLAGHAELHLAQAWQVRRDPDFPQGTA